MLRILTTTKKERKKKTKQKKVGFIPEIQSWFIQNPLHHIIPYLTVLAN